MKKKKSKANKKKKNEKDNEKEMPKEIGVYNDFLVFEKIDNINDNILKKLEKEYLGSKKESDKRESRFSSLFKELIEMDKKAHPEDEKEKDKKKEEKKENNDNNQNKIIEETLNDINNINFFEKINDDNNNINKIEDKTNDNIYNSNNNINKNYFYSTTFSNNNNECNITGIDYRNTFFPNLGNFSQNNKMSLNSNSSSGSGSRGNSTNDTGYTGYSSFSNKSTFKNSIDINKNTINDNKISINDNKNIINENNNLQEILFDPNVNISKILSLEDKRTTIMIKNIPNKFTRSLLLSTIDQNFKGTYDLFILPTDGNRNKNFGYSFINFTSSYFIPYFYFMFNNKKWSSTNSKKICEITYSKVQGRSNLISYYANKIIFYNNVQEVTNEQRYLIPNDYKEIFIKLFPKHPIEEYNFYFITKMPT